MEASQGPWDNATLGLKTLIRQQLYALYQTTIALWTRPTPPPTGNVKWKGKAADDKGSSVGKRVLCAMISSFQPEASANIAATIDLTTVSNWKTITAQWYSVLHS